MFKGSCVALVTPLTPLGEVDEPRLKDLVEWHISEGTDAIVAVGSTGEGATLTPQEQIRVITLVYQTAKKRIPVIAAAGTNVTATTIERTQAALAIGVDGCLVVTPYYNRPTQHGLVEHYTAIAKAVSIPLILYNVPSRTGCDLLADTVATLSKIPSIIGIKESTGNLERLAQLQQQCTGDFLLYSGDDSTACEFILQGGHGDISVTANVAPKLMHQMCIAALAFDAEKAKAIDQNLQPLHRMLGAESNPIPVKWALEHMGKIQGGLRLPLTPFSEKYHRDMTQALITAGLQ
jgi:4-hydroxy-tetrahydrodipicolinate synthase